MLKIQNGHFRGILIYIFILFVNLIAEHYERTIVDVFTS